MKAEAEEMIWQNHEKRIVTLEVTQDEFSKQMSKLEDVVIKESGEQKALLNKLIDHHLSTNKFKLSQFWKLVLNLSGASSIIVVVIYAAIQFFKGG